MDDDRRRLIEELFCDAAELPAAQRAAFLEARCGSDVALRSEVESLLAHDAAETHQFQPGSLIHADQLLERLQPIIQPDATRPSGDTPLADGPTEMPERIGAYRILEVLGEGGMGVVYRAEQESPRRTVALKVIRPDYITRQTLRRFEYEASVLGRLQHPGIAQIYEAGTAPSPGSGRLRAYFAMELIRGKPLTDYTRTNASGIADRLTLMAKVCDAVDHAHRNGVIHRDLKPGNILVDDNGEPKILDFGVARAIDSEKQMTTIQTDVGQLIGTVPYMSPEQIAGDPAAIDTRSDVYALGVNLFELLTGRLPHDLSRASLLEAARIIQEDPPTQLSSVNRVLKGDIETIVTKALEKEPAHRYQSAADLAADLRRYLRDEPIQARPLSAVYQFRKFAKRNRTLVVSTIAVFVVLIAGLIVSTSQYYKAETARKAEAKAHTVAEERRLEAEHALGVAEAARKAEAKQRSIAEANAERAMKEAGKLSGVNRFLRDMLGSINPARALGHDVSVRDVLDTAARRIQRRGNELDPEVRAEVETTIGQTYLRLGLLDEAEPHLVSALETRQRIFDGLHPDVAQAMTNLAELRHEQGQLEAAADLMSNAVEILRAVYAGTGPQVAAALHNLAGLEKERNRLDHAEQLFREALAIRRPDKSTTPADLAVSLKALGTVLQERGELGEAEQLLREALDLRRANLPANHPDIATSLSNLGYVVSQRGRPDEAERLFDEALAIQQEILPAGHPALALTLTMLGDARVQAGRAADAEAPLREALQIREAALGPDHFLVSSTKSVLGDCLAEQGKLTDAEPLLLDSCQALEANADAPGQLRRAALERVVRFYERTGRDDQAAAWRAKLAAAADTQPEVSLETDGS